MDDDKKAALTKLGLAAATKPLNLGVLAVGIVAAIVLALMQVGGSSSVGIAMLLLSVLAYGGLAAMDLQNKRFVEDTLKGAKEARRMRIELDEEDGYVPADKIALDALRKPYETVVHAFDRVKGAFEAAGDDLKDHLRESVERCVELVKEAGKTAQKGTQLRIYLDSENADEMAKEARKLDDQAKRTTDPTAQATFRQAAEAKRQQLATYHQIEGLYDRVQAQLSVIETSLETVNAKLVKLRATDVEQATAINQSIADHLGSVQSDIHILESTVEETLQEFTTT